MYARTVASLGMVAYAAHVVSLNAESIFVYASLRLFYCRFYYGGAKPRSGATPRSTDYSYRVRKMALIVMGFMGLMFACFPVSFMKIFTDDARYNPYAYMTMRFLAYIQIPEAIGFVMSGAFAWCWRY